MNINLDKVLGWDLQLTIGGKEYDTRPPTLAELALLQSIDKQDLDQSQKQIQSFAAALLKPAPSVELGAEQAQAVVIAVMEHWKSSVQKNSQTIVAKVKAAMVTTQTSTSGNSTAR